MTDAAECTNGLSPEEKIQHLSETTFGLMTLIIKVTEQMNRSNNIAESFTETVRKIDDRIKRLEEDDAHFAEEHNKLAFRVSQSKNKRDIRQLDWKNVAKLCIVQPWVWLFLSVVCFSPKGLETVKLLLDRFAS